MIRANVRSGSRPFVVGYQGGSVATIPRSSLLLYIPTPNDYRDLEWEQDVGVDESLTGYLVIGDTAFVMSIQAATGYTLGSTDNPLFDAMGDPVVANAADLSAWIKPENTLFNGVKLAIYTADVDVAIVDKAKKALKIT